MAKKVPEPIYEAIGRQIEHARVQRRLSQAELGKRLRHPLTRASISNMELGRQRVLAHVLLEMAEVLEVSPGDLLPSAPQAQAPAAAAPLTDQLGAFLEGETVAELLAELSTTVESR